MWYLNKPMNSLAIVFNYVHSVQQDGNGVIEYTGYASGGSGGEEDRPADGWCRG